MTSCSTAHPPPHAPYLVERPATPSSAAHLFIATPCYGMHHPWWVPSTPTGETDPIAMEDGDRWMAIEPYVRLGSRT